MKNFLGKRVFSHYVHVDNGGYSISVMLEDHAARIIIEDGYYGYSQHTTTLNENVTPYTLRQIAAKFMEAADEIEKYS